MNAVAPDTRFPYFAYGSNLLSRRMVERVPSARPLEVASVDGQRLSLGKAGRDGSGKATLIAERGARSWGVVYSIDQAHWPRLDGFEPGYTRVPMTVIGYRSERVLVLTYVAPETLRSPLATAEYKRCIVDGAREHGLPADYVAWLEHLPARSDAAGIRRVASPRPAPQP